MCTHCWDHPKHESSIKSAHCIWELKVTQTPFSPVAKSVWVVWPLPAVSNRVQLSSTFYLTPNRKSTLGTSLSREMEAAVSMHRWANWRQQHLVLAVNCQLRAAESCQCYRLQWKYLAEDVIIMCSWLFLNSVTWCIMQITTLRCTVKEYCRLDSSACHDFCSYLRECL